jgi:hypothetical protein
MKIISARITPKGPGMFGDMPEVHATFEDKVERKLFSYYPDEISFTANEFIGLTSVEAGQLRLKRDVAYLRS